MDDAEFEALMAEKVASDPETPTDPSESEAPVEETAAEATDEPEAVAELEPEAEVEVEPEAPQFGDEVANYLQKYDGNVEKAIQAAIHAQSKIGEQGQELGELRRMVQELMDRPEPKQATSPFVPEQVQDAIAENPGQVAHWAAQNEQTHVYEAAMQEWYEQNPYQAGRFERAIEREMLKAEIRNEVNPAVEATAERERARSMNDAHRALTAKYPDFQQVLESATPNEVAGLDRNLLATVMQENPQAAMEMTYRWVAAERARQGATSQAQRTEQVREEKRQASVVTAEETHSTTEPTTLDKLTAFMLEPNPWDVQAGLTRE